MPLESLYRGGTCNIPYSKVPCTTCKPHALVLSMTHTYEHETLRAICVCACESQRAVATDGRTVQITDSVTIEIAKGARDGMTLQFKHRGNEYPGTVTCTYLPSYLPTFICLARFAFSASSSQQPVWYSWRHHPDSRETAHALRASRGRSSIHRDGLTTASAVWLCFGDCTLLPLVCARGSCVRALTMVAAWWLAARVQETLDGRVLKTDILEPV